MAFIRTQHYDNAIQKVKICVGKELGLAYDEDAYVVFREPTEREVVKLRSANDEEDRLSVFQELFSSTLVSHNFFETDEQPMESYNVIALLFEKISTTDKLVTEYTQKVFRSRLNQADES